MKFKVFFSIVIFVFLSQFQTINAQTEVNPNLKSPQATVRYFLKIMTQVELDKAAIIDEALPTLELDSISETERITDGREIARSLFRIIYSFTFKLTTLPTELKTNKYTIPIGQDKGINIILKKTNAGWKFDYTQTLSKLSKYKEILKPDYELRKNDTSTDNIFFSPRETIRIFLSNMQKGDQGVLKAAETLDLSQVERSLRKEIGRERAIMLNAILERSQEIDLIEISNSTKAAPALIIDDPSGRVIIEKTTNTDSTVGSWKFSAQTVSNLPNIYDAFKNKTVITNINSTSKLPIAIRVRDYMKTNFPTLMREQFLLENWQWIGLFVVVFLGLAFGKVIIHFLANGIKMIFTKGKVDIDQDTNDRFMTPVSISVTSIFWWGGLAMLGLPSSARLVLLVTTKVVAAVSSVWAGYRLIDIVGNFLIGKANQTENKFDNLLAPLITRALKVMVIIIGLVFIADIFAIDIDKIMAGLGLGGLAFALAAKDTISNLFGSITILVDRPFQIGDWVTIGKADGTVESVGIRSTRIRTFYDSIITIPNAELINAQIDNYGARRYRRINTTVELAYDTPPEKIDAFCEGIRELIKNHPCTRKDYFIVNLQAITQYSLSILVYCFVRTPDWVAELREKHRLLADILRLAKQLGVELAVPARTIYAASDKKEHTNIPENQEKAFEEGIKIADDIMLKAGLTLQKEI